MIGLSGCLKGEVAEELTFEHYDKAGSRGDVPGYFREREFLSRDPEPGLPEEQRIQNNLLKLEQDLGIPIVATNDSHYLCRRRCARAGRDGCIRTGKSINDTNRLKFANNQFFVKSYPEMQKEFLV